MLVEGRAEAAVLLVLLVVEVNVAWTEDSLLLHSGRARRPAAVIQVLAARFLLVEEGDDTTGDSGTASGSCAV